MSDGGVLNGPRVLLVEDEATLRDIFAEMLRTEGYGVEVAADGAQALAKLTADSFDILITDIFMPYLDGWQLIAAAVEKQPMLRVVAMTGGDASENRRRAELQGVPLLQKPFPLGALHAALQPIPADRLLE